MSAEGLTQREAAFLGALVRRYIEGGRPGLQMNARDSWQLHVRLQRQAGLVPACPLCGAEPASGQLACGWDGDGCPLVDTSPGDEPARFGPPIPMGERRTLTPEQDAAVERLGLEFGRCAVRHLDGGLVQLVAMSDDVVHGVHVLDPEGTDVLAEADAGRTALVRSRTAWLRRFDEAPDGSPEKQRATERLDRLGDEVLAVERLLDRYTEGL